MRDRISVVARTSATMAMNTQAIETTSVVNGPSNGMSIGGMTRP